MDGILVRDLLLIAGFAVLTLVMRWWLRRGPRRDLELEVRCGGCGRLLAEPVDLPGIARAPCPACGSLAREKVLLHP